MSSINNKRKFEQDIEENNKRWKTLSISFDCVTMIINEENKRLINQRDKVEQKNTELKLAINNKDVQIQQANQEISILSDDIEELSADNETLEEANFALRVQNDNLVARCQYLEREINITNDQIARSCQLERRMWEELRLYREIITSSSPIEVNDWTAQYNRNWLNTLENLVERQALFNCKLVECIAKHIHKDAGYVGPTLVDWFHSNRELKISDL